MTSLRAICLKIAGCVVLAFAASMVITWALQDYLATRDANRLIENTFTDVEDAIVERVNARLVRQAMAARERIEEGHPLDGASLRQLARELQVTEICVADAKGRLTHSSVDSYVGFDFATASDQAREMMCLLRDKSEFCQGFRRNSATGALRKYVGVWRPEGGFVQISCDGESLRNLSRTSLTGITSTWHVSDSGCVVITTPEGLVISDLTEEGREGTHWHEPDGRFYWQRRDIAGFTVYVMIPKAAAAVTRNVLFGTTACLTALALVFVAVLVGLVIAAFVRRQIREQTERELRMATDIQASAMPSVFPPFPDETSFDVYACMHPAREVGGDFYDFYFTGPRTLVFLVADVSGKGVPAAMFMMRAKALLKSSAQTGKPIAKVVAEANDALCEGNEANMFVTAWVGELHIDTGAVTYVSAGHNPPVWRHADGTADYLHGAAGLVLGAMPGVAYPSHDIRLAPGDDLYLYTDGITEQPDAAGALFGEARLLDCLRAAAPSLQARLDAVQKAVIDYAGAVEQADDCTQLVLRYRGPSTVTEHVYKPTMEDLVQATVHLEEALEGVPDRTRMTLMVAADEIFANIVRHSGATDWTLRVERMQHPDAVRLVFTDDGSPFDPLAQRDPDTTLSAEARSVGGMGILIVKKTMSPVAYARRGTRNVLTMGLTYGT